MRAGRASSTARGVALLRAIATSADGPWPDVYDPHALALAPDLAPLVHVGRALPLVARALSAGLLTHVALRTAAIDRAIVSRAASAEQLVILGAGLDARAHRLAELASVEVLEVDHPATQALKRERLERSHGAPLARALTYVAVDFERDDLATCLARAGHDPARRTLWLWEGVTPYLGLAAIDATLAVIEARSAPASWLLVTYSTPALAEVPMLPAALVPERVVRAMFGLVGEPLVTTLEPSGLRALLGVRGLVVREDSGDLEWARQHMSRGRPRVVITERLAIAERV